MTLARILNMTNDEFAAFVASMIVARGADYDVVLIKHPEMLAELQQIIDDDSDYAGLQWEVASAFLKRFG